MVTRSQSLTFCYDLVWPGGAHGRTNVTDKINKTRLIHLFDMVVCHYGWWGFFLMFTPVIRAQTPYFTPGISVQTIMFTLTEYRYGRGRNMSNRYIVQLTICEHLSGCYSKRYPCYKHIQTNFVCNKVANWIHNDYTHNFILSK